MLVNLYRTYISHSLRKKIYDLFLGDFLLFFRTFNQRMKCKMMYWFKLFLPENELNEAYIFMGKYGLTSYPFNSSLKYKGKTIEVLKDDANGLSYVIHHDKRLYFPNNRSSQEIADMYRSLLIEQDEDSPHRYVKSYADLKGKIVLDIGSAEGVFSLDAVDYASHIYLFECDSEWVDALKTTFSPWEQKVTIVEKYVANKSGDHEISIDDFFEGKESDNLFFKMDIEGAENLALVGAKKILQKGNNIVLSVCTYHRLHDVEDISTFLSSLEYKFEFTKGYMYWAKMLNRGVIRAYK